MTSVESFLQVAISRFQNPDPASPAAQDEVMTARTLGKLEQLRTELRTKLGDNIERELPEAESSPNLLIIVNDFLLDKTTSDQIAKMVQATLDRE